MKVDLTLMVPNGSFVSQDWVNQLLNLAYSNCSLTRLGVALHALQDSYSHASYNCPAGHGWDTIRGKDPDDIDNDLDKANQMMIATRSALRNFINNCGGPTRKCCPK